MGNVCAQDLLSAQHGRALAQDVGFTRNTSESLNLVAKSFSPLVLKAGDEVCVTIMEHHSDLIPWQQACRAAGATLVFLYPNEDGVITDGAFVGDGCAISQASTDIMLGMIVGQKKEDALHYADLFMRMIRGEATEEEIESLEEASALRDIAHMPARVKCAMLGWRTLAEALGEKTE